VFSADLVQAMFPAYPIESPAMRPVTKITVFGLRFAVILLAAYWLAIFVGTHLPSIISVAPDVNDKSKHFIAFFFLGVLMCYVTNSPRWFRRFATIGLVGMLYAAIDELTQYFVPGRHPDPMDFLADSAGLWTGISVYLLARLCRKVSQRPPLPT
jgi:VanZ family protein